MSSTVDTSNWIPGTRYFTRITDENHSAWLYIVSALTICYIATVFVIRFVVKYGMYGHDDWVLLLSTALAFGQTIALLIGLPEGLGKSTALFTDKAIGNIESVAAAHVFLFFLAHTASKFSSALLALRLFKNGRKRNTYFCWALVGASAMYGVFAVLTLAIACPAPGFPLSANDGCSNRHIRWQLITAIDIVTELTLIAVPILLIMDVQIKRNAKMLIAAVFAVRLPDIAFSLCNLYAARKRDSFQGDVGLEIVQPIIWMQTEIIWSILAASVPCLKTFMRPFDKIDEETWRSGNDAYATQRSGRSWRDNRDGAVPLESIKSHKRGMVLNSTGHSVLASEKSLTVRPDLVGNDVTIARGGPDAISDDGHRRSWGSQERIIKTQTQWVVTHDSQNGKDPYVIP